MPHYFAQSSYNIIGYQKLMLQGRDKKAGQMMGSKNDIPIQFVHCPYFVEIIPVVNVCRVILCIATINSKPLPVIINHFIILQMG